MSPEFSLSADSFRLARTCSSNDTSTSTAMTNSVECINAEWPSSNGVILDTRTSYTHLTKAVIVRLSKL